MKKTFYFISYPLLFAGLSLITSSDMLWLKIVGAVVAFASAFVVLYISSRSTAFSKFDFDSMTKGLKTLYLISFPLLFAGLLLIRASDMLWLTIVGAVVAFASTFVVLYISSRHTKDK